MAHSPETSGQSLFVWFNDTVRIGKERVYSIMAATVALMAVVLAVARGAPEWLRWSCLGLALLILMFMVSATSYSPTELFENAK